MRKAGVLYFVGACLLLSGFATSSYSQELTADDLSAIHSWSAENEFAKNLVSRFSGFPNFEDLNFDRAASLITIPLKTSPGTGIAGLAKESQVIGAIYLSSGSTRFRLGPGIYLVNVKFDNEKFRWIVNFLNQDRKPVAQPVQARVREVSKTELPITYVDRSVCFRADNWDICF